ncbi:amidase [Rhodococcus sp. JS3073]|uniref:amidase n=1 Tax=Rhodococcus sp. JS3073 TaxID=3002901 RepID=UPI002286B2D6|nr:amidase family protein [Rhodococcus sp. JS3073]WAM19561.1 amidase family protein [Rhodococcus sp. JS3073]
MLSVEEYSSEDATGLAELIVSGHVTPEEVHAAALEAVTATDKRLKAVVEGPWDEPLESSRSGVFAGVPFVLKDILCHAAGVPVHSGSASLAEGAVFGHDSLLMSRFRDAGLATIATTKTPEFALSVGTEPRWGGPTHNPWDPNRSAGGSSGGSAALVAAGAVPIGHANDGAGSIRIPACHTGLVGLKPSRGRIPIGPDLQEVMYGNATEFAVTRTVRDTALLLDAVHGNAPGEKYAAPGPGRPYVDELRPQEEFPLRIAVCADSWSSRSVDPEVVTVIESTMSALQEMGHHVEYVRPPIDWEDFLSALTVTWCAGTASAVVPLFEASAGNVRREHFEATTLASADAGRHLTPLDLGRAFDIYNRASRVMGSFFEEWDLWLTPTAIGVAPTLGYFDADNDSYNAAEWVRKCAEYYPTCALYNVVGAPAVNVPIGVSTAGLPIGVQLGAAVFREDLLIRTASALEQARPWSDRRPKLHIQNIGRDT